MKLLALDRDRAAFWLRFAGRLRRLQGWAAFVLGLACLACAAADPGAVPLGAQSPAWVADGERLAHPVVKGALGPWPAVEVRLVQSSQVDDGPFTAQVVVPVQGGSPKVYQLPPPDETESAFMMTVRSVMFRRIGKPPERSLIVLYSAARIGPGHDPYFAACVYSWDGAAFARDTDAENLLSGARDSAEVARRLTARTSR